MKQLNIHKICTEPYRFFFPFGFLSLLMGIGIWIPAIGIETHYPSELHQLIMTNGFMGFYIAGFLMTAIPQFSKSFNAHLLEILGYFLVTMLGFILNIYSGYAHFSLISLFQAGLLLFFVLIRIVKRKANPPYTFNFYQ